MINNLKAYRSEFGTYFVNTKTQYSVFYDDESNSLIIDENGQINDFLEGEDVSEFIDENSLSVIFNLNEEEIRRLCE